jgi:hydrogenase maturation protease
MTPVLVIAYGNPLRSDDGVAWQAAETLRRKLPSSQAEIICVHQLTPELAERLSCSQSVIFLDASCGGEPGKITCEPLSLSADVHFAHQLTPTGLLALGKVLYGGTPRAFSASLSGKSFDHGDTLSSPAINSLPRLVARVCELVEHLSDASLVNASLEV